MISRRDFMKLGSAGLATILIGSKLPWLGVTNAYAATQNLTITITDALKDMHTKNTPSPLVDPNPVSAQCYYWIYKMTADGVNLPADMPGPTICATRGDSINVTITNLLDEPHSFFIPGIFDSGPIAPNATFNGTFLLSVSGAHLYYDNLNAPVNRMMGLHGGMVVLPSAAATGHNFTPYDNPSPHVQALFDSFGTDVFPGLKWEEGDPATNTPVFRQYVWTLHQSSPRLFAEVGNLPAGQIYDPQLFQQKFHLDTFSPTRQNSVPEYFTINGQSGFFSHFSPTITPIGRVGEPIVIHIINAGLWTHSMHFHFNHFYVTYDNGVSDNPLWVDIYNIDPMDRIDYVLPFMRPPNIPTVRGLGLPETPMQTDNGHPCWPPLEELDLHIPDIGTTALGINGQPVSLAQRLSPLCYPMHDHSEATQTSQGGNYNTGMISGAYCTGDRNTQGFMNFPMEPDFFMMYRNIRGVSSSIVDNRGTVPAPGTDPHAPPL
ncbi:MAG: multicopper oxidase domain-containing protein [Geobacteraceae bacterium]